MGGDRCGIHIQTLTNEMRKKVKKNDMHKGKECLPFAPRAIRMRAKQFCMSIKMKEFLRRI